MTETVFALSRHAFAAGAKFRAYLRHPKGGGCEQLSEPE